MSFLASHQRGYDSLSHPDLSQQPPIHPAQPPRLPMHALSSFDPLPLPPFASAPPAPMQSNPAHTSHISDRSHIALPRVGQTRCCELFPIYLSDRSSIEPTFVPFPCLPSSVIIIDWTLLTSDLCFLYLDPVLATHLGDQADLLIGKSLLAYVHPDEQASAEVDLGAVLESRTLHGSVTR